MRTREDIEDAGIGLSTNRLEIVVYNTDLIIELLLDIRDLLKPEIIGVPLTPEDKV